MLALTAILILVPLLYIPGYVLAHALLGAVQTADMLERHYERVVLGALLNGWLAFTLAELGVFALWLHLVLLVLVCAAAGMIAARRGAFHLSQTPLGIVARSQGSGARGQGTVVRRSSFVLRRHWDVIGFAVVGLIFLVLVARPFEVVVGVRDAGVYANTGFAIARTGGIVQRDPLAAQLWQDEQVGTPQQHVAAKQAEANLLGVQHPHRWISTRLRAVGFYIPDGDLSSGRVVPQGFHLFPAWIGLLASLLGLQGGLLATGLMGLLGVWSVGMLGRRLAGAWVGVLAMLLLALNGVEVWFSRYSTTETTAQFLVFAGLYGFALMQNREPRTRNQGDTLTHGSRFAVLGALIAGFAFGQLALTRIDFVLAVGPILAYLFYVWLTRRWTRLHTLLAAGLGAMLLHAAIHIATIARAYFFDTMYARLQDYALTSLLALPFLPKTLQDIYFSDKNSKIGVRLDDAGHWRWNIARIAEEFVVVIVVILAVLALRRWGQPVLAWFERGVQRWSVWLLRGAALVIVLAACYGYLIRPQIISRAVLAELPQCLAARQWSSGACLKLQGYIGAPIALPGQAREVYEIPLANMVRVGWYLSPLGVVFGVAGFALLWRREMSRASWPLLLIGLLASVFFIRQSYGTSDQTYIYILRRFVPHVYPVFCLGIAYALVALCKNREPRTENRPSVWRSNSQFLVVGSISLTLLLVTFTLVTNRTLYQHVEYQGALAQIGAIAQRFTPNDILLFRNGSRDQPDILVTPLKYAYGINGLTLKNDEASNYAQQLADYVRRRQAEGHALYAVLGPGGALAFPGLALVPDGAIKLRLREFEQLTNQKPTNVQNIGLDFTVYRIVPAAAPAPTSAIALDDYAAQVRGFYNPEQIKGVNLMWTNGDALLRFAPPSTAAPLTVTVQLAGGTRPAALGTARACATFAPERGYWANDPKAPPQFQSEQCFDLAEQMQSYIYTFDPRAAPASATGSYLLRISSKTWTPANVDQAQNDQRNLGVQFGGLAVAR